MNNVIETRPAASRSHVDGWQPCPELVQAMREIATITEGDDTAVVTDREISFKNGAERTTITASKVDLVAVDGLQIAERIDIRTSLPEWFVEMTPEQLAAANTFATTGAIIVGAQTGTAQIVSTLPVFEADTDALERLYPMVVGRGARVHLFGPLAAASYMAGEAPPQPEAVGLPGWDQPSRWGEEDFDYAADRMRAANIYCNAGATGLTAEFAWEEGASSAMLGDRTSLFRLHADIPHPVVGNGLFFRLSLPLNIAAEQLAACVNYLNVFEMNGVDTPPFFGAWCSPLDDETLTYAGFWPNCMHQFGTAANIAFWCFSRSRIARQAIGNL